MIVDEEHRAANLEAIPDLRDPELNRAVNFVFECENFKEQCPYDGGPFDQPAWFCDFRNLVLNYYHDLINPKPKE